MSAGESRVSCDRVAEELVRVLDGSAPAQLLAHVVDCDGCRDLRYEAERARDLVNEAGRDFQLPDGLQPLLAAHTPEPSAPIAPLSATARRGAALGALAKRWALPVFAVGAVAVVLLGRGKTPGTSIDDPELVGPPWRGKVARVLTRSGKLELCAPGGSACHEARAGDEIPAGSELRTDRGTLAELAFSDGSDVSLDRETTLRLSTRGRGGELVRGRVVADVERQAHSSVRFEFTSGHVDVLGTKFSLLSDDESAVVHVARGEVRLSNRSGSDAVVLAGEEGRIDAGAAPVTSPTSALGEALGWSEAVQLDGVDDEPDARPRALGELKARKPGEKSERSGAVSLASHSVRVKIAGSVARTEVEELFTNHTDDVLEGIFRFPLPPDAKIERLALEVDGKLEEGAFLDRDRASAIWRGAIVNAAPQLRREIKDEIVWVPGPWRDPALLEWQRGGRFELRIYPIPRRGSRRVVLAYSQVVKQAAAVRHYSYPLAFDPSGNGTPLDFSLDVVVRGSDPAFRVRTPGWDVSRQQADGAEHLHFDARSFVPSGDFALDYALPERDVELSAWAYRDPSASGDPYVALALRPRLPRPREHGPARSVALVVDASRSVFGENYRRATALATRVARDLEVGDRVTVLACDSTCREMPGDLRRPGADTAREVRRFLEHLTPEGASDITLAVARGFASLPASDRPPHVIYIGDGTATVGPIRPATIERAVRATLPRGGRVTALGIGPESDADSLLALSRGGGGTALPYVPGQPLADVALSAISALSGASLTDVQLKLPAGITQLAPARLDPITVGSELIVTGRLSDAQLDGEAVLSGRVDGRPFQQRYPLHLSVSDSSGNAFVPRLFAAARIADLERDGSDSAKREAIALSTQHRVASRYTSLLVLESEAMYKAFGLESGRKTPDYTADVEAEGDSSNGELALSDDDAQSLAKGKRGAGTASGPVLGDLSSRAAGQPAAKAAAPAPRGAPAVRSDRRSPAFAPPPAAVAAEPRRERAATEEKRPTVVEVEPPFELAPPRSRPMVPMRRIWQRHGEIFTDRFVPGRANARALAEAERALQSDDSRRQNLKQAFALSSAAGDLGQAAPLAERWIEKEPLDPEAITALADVEARRGRRELAIRLLGSVLDVRPGDTASHKRLARLERWSGHAELGCRHTIAIAEGRSRDLALVADAVRCTRALGMSELAEALLDSAQYGERAVIERRASQTPDDDARLSGDVRLEARWSGGPDLDLALLDTEGHRISWLGAATRSVISARDVTSSTVEGLALRGAAPGEYVVELTRGAGSGSAQGELVVSVAGSVRRIPFTFDGDRKTVALLRISMRSHLVTL
jgi:hypothetical protein